VFVVIFASLVAGVVLHILSRSRMGSPRRR
jgi:hypothetical protein